MTIGAPLAAPFFLLSSRGRRRIAERLGSWGSIDGRPVWFHGASVGEVQALAPLMTRMQRDDPSARFLLTATSPTALDGPESSNTDRRILPFDAPWCLDLALRSVSPAELIVCETELWPSLFASARKRGIPYSFVNAHISDYTVEWYRRARSLIAPIFEGARRICAMSERHAARFVELGAPADRVIATGNTKYDQTPSISTSAETESLRRELFGAADDHVPVVVLGSIRPGEETWWFESIGRAIANSSATGRRMRMVVAPRHAEKFPYFREKLAASGLSWSQWTTLQTSTNSTAQEKPDIVLLDVMGKLEPIYSMAALSFVGATLVDIGGHNPLEPAAYGSPVAVGPYVSKIRDIVSDMESQEGILRVSQSEDISRLVDRVLAGDPSLREIGRRGAEVAAKHRGATERVLDALRQARSAADSDLREASS